MGMVMLWNRIWGPVRIILLKRAAFFFSNSSFWNSCKEMRFWVQVWEKFRTKSTCSRFSIPLSQWIENHHHPGLTSTNHPRTSNLLIPQTVDWISPTTLDHLTTQFHYHHSTITLSHFHNHYHPGLTSTNHLRPPQLPIQLSQSHSHHHPGYTSTNHPRPPKIPMPLSQLTEYHHPAGIVLHFIDHYTRSIIMSAHLFLGFFGLLE